MSGFCDMCGLTACICPGPDATEQEQMAGIADEPLTADMLDEITEAYCDANMKCNDETGLYDVRPGCEVRRDAARIWLTVTGVGLLIDEVGRLRAALAEPQARALSDEINRLYGELADSKAREAKLRDAARRRALAAEGEGTRDDRPV